MKNYIILTLAVAGTLSAGSGFKSTQDAMTAIFNTYNSLLQAPNIYDQKISFNELVQLGDKLNSHIMGKQGVLGSTSKRKGVGQRKFGEYDNVFDLWEVNTFPFFTDIVNAIKTVRVTKSAQNKSGNELGIWQTNSAIEAIIDRAKKIRSDALLGDKKKLADIIIFFMEQNRELINKAVQDFKYL